MDDPGTLIYVAFLVISLIAGWVRNRKKSEDAEPIDSNSPISKSEIDEAIELQRKERLAAEDRLRILSMDALSAQKKKDLKIRKPATSATDVDLESDDICEEHENERFDARKAFIYSEILNPPHL